MAQSADILQIRPGNKDKNEIAVGYVPTDDEAKTIGEYTRKFFQFSSVRTEADQYWPLYRRAYKAIPEYASDGETVMSLNPSTEFQVTQAYLAQINANAPDYEVVAHDENDRGKVDAIKLRLEITDRNDNVIHKFRANSEQAAKLGMSVIFVGYEIENRVVTDSTFDEKKKQIITETKVETVGRHSSRVVDMDNFWCDNVYDFDFARQCIEEEYVTLDEFEARYKDGSKSRFPFKNCEFVQPMYITRDIRKQRDTEIEEKGDTFGQFIKLSHWYGVPNGDGKGDFYRVIANDQIVIRDTENPYWHKMLPYTWKNFVPSDLYIWRSMGIPRLIAQNKEMVKLAVDGYFKQAISATSPETIVRDGVTFEKPLSNTPNHMNRLKGSSGNINNDIFERRAPSPDSSALEMINFSQREIIQTVGIPYTDITQDNVSEKATKVLARKEIQSARSKVYQLEEDKCLERFYTLRVKNIMQFDADPILDGDGVTYQKDLVKGTYQYVGKNGILKTDDFRKALSLRKVNDNGQTTIYWTPEILRANVEVKILSGSNQPVFREIERQNFNEIFFQLPMLMQVKQSLDALKMDSEEIITKFLEINNFTTSKSKQEEPQSIENMLVQEGIEPPPVIPIQ